MKPLALDLCCGLGGWSDGLAATGFDVLGVEINEEIAGLYNHPVMVADVTQLDPLDFTGYDLIIGSPPCREFTAAYSGHWNDPQNPERGMILVNAFLDFVTAARPRFWLMENVPGLTKHLDMKPRAKVRMGKGMYRCLWGTYPPFLVPTQMDKKIFRITGMPSRLRRWYRAKIPFAIAASMAQAVKEQL